MSGVWRTWTHALLYFLGKIKLKTISPAQLCFTCSCLITCYAVFSLTASLICLDHSVTQPSLLQALDCCSKGAIDLRLLTVLFKTHCKFDPIWPLLNLTLLMLFLCLCSCWCSLLARFPLSGMLPIFIFTLLPHLCLANPLDFHEDLGTYIIFPIC